MGWTSFNYYGNPTAKDLILKEFPITFFGGENELKECVQKGTSVWALLFNKKENEHWVFLALTRKENRHGYREFWYKEMTTESGPYDYSMPKKWFKYLNMEKGYNKEYYERYMKHLEEKKSGNFPKTWTSVMGKTLEVKYKVDTNYKKTGDVVTGIMNKSGLYVKENFGTYRIPLKHMKHFLEYARVIE